jgi:hypothetical protein
MILTRKLVCLLLLVIPLTYGCSTPAGGRWPREGVASPEEASPPAQVVPGTGLLLSLAADRNDYLLGEPVYLAVLLENTLTEPQKVFGSLDPTDGVVTIFVRTPDGRRMQFVPFVEADNDPSIFIDLAPAGVIGRKIAVFFGANGWTFMSPGKYELTAVYRHPGAPGKMAETTSAPISIEISSSNDGSGEFLVADKDPESLEAGKFLTWMAGDHLVKGHAHLQMFLERWPKSPLADFVHSAFARSYSRSFRNYIKGEVRPPDCPRVLDHLKQVTGTRLPRNVQIQNAMTQSRCAAQDQKFREATRFLRQGREIAGDRPEYRGILSRIQEMEQALTGAQH